MSEVARRLRQERTLLTTERRDVELSSARLKAKELQVREQLPELAIRVARSGHKTKLVKLLKLVEIDLTALSNVPPSRFRKVEDVYEPLKGDVKILEEDVETIDQITEMRIEDEYVGQRVTQRLRLELVL